MQGEKDPALLEQLHRTLEDEREAVLDFLYGIIDEVRSYAACCSPHLVLRGLAAIMSLQVALTASVQSLPAPVS